MSEQTDLRDHNLAHDDFEGACHSSVPIGNKAHVQNTSTERKSGGSKTMETLEPHMHLHPLREKAPVNWDAEVKPEHRMVQRTINGQVFRVLETKDGQEVSRQAVRDCEMALTPKMPGTQETV